MSARDHSTLVQNRVQGATRSCVAVAAGRLSAIASRWYTPCHTMPTKLPRIAVVRDAALDQALASVRELIGSDRPAAAQVHDLAVKGAEALIADAEHRRRLRLELNDMAISEDPPWDREVLRDIDRLGWGHT